jgi:hypothetical protein
MRIWKQAPVQQTMDPFCFSLIITLFDGKFLRSSIENKVVQGDLPLPPTSTSAAKERWVCVAVLEVGS